MPNVATKAVGTVHRGANPVNASQVNRIGAISNRCAARPRSRVRHNYNTTPASIAWVICAKTSVISVLIRVHTPASSRALTSKKRSDRGRLAAPLQHQC